MSKKAQGAPGSDNNELLMVACVVLLAGIGWWLMSAKIAAVVLFVRAGQVWVINQVGGSLGDLGEWMRLIDRKQVKLRDLYLVSDTVGRYTRYLAVPLIAWLGWRVFRASPTERFKTRYSDVTLPRAVAPLYPWIQISLVNDFSKMDTDKGPWAMAMTERQFVRAHRLRNAQGEYDEGLAEAQFIKQLGPLWNGYRSMRGYSRGLLAMLLARIERDFETSDKILIQLATSAAGGKLDLTGCSEVVARYKGSRALKKLVAQHAYERTLLMAMLETARGGEAGKDYLPPNWFLWLKGVDRTLWYAMADVGRRAPHVESAGVFGHWLAEKARGRKLEMPFVKNAVSGLRVELDKYLEDESEERGGIDLDDDLLEVRAAPPAPPIPPPGSAWPVQARR